MTAFRKTNLGAQIELFLLAVILTLAGSGCSSTQLPKGMIGRLGRYDYSPTIVQTGNVKQFWWCGSAHNPTNPDQDSDAILYESVDSTTGAVDGPLTVLAETKESWDSVYICNPKVIGGTFDNPLGDGQSYGYAMYYVGTADGVTNNIGVAFSKDGIAWKKYPEPVIQTSYSTGYGVGQPALYNRDHKSGITMFYEDSNPTVHHVAATSADGVHFTIQGTLTDNGLNLGCPPTWGDMAYDSKTKYWYAVFNRPLRDPSTTGNIIERGQLGIELYRIPDGALLTGSSPWEEVATFDSNTTGFESNFIAGFVRDSDGNLNVGSYPAIQMYVSVSDPQPGWDASAKNAGNSARVETWDIAPITWVPGQPLKPLNRYYNTAVHMVTTGWVNPSGGFESPTLLGRLYESPQQGATVPLYQCIDGKSDYFVSLDSGCEGKRVLGMNGYGYAQPNGASNLVPLYRCSTGHDHFVSKDPKCEGATTDKLLGYAVP